jgi:hypothetical protein
MTYIVIREAYPGRTEWVQVGKMSENILLGFKINFGLISPSAKDELFKYSNFEHSVRKIVTDFFEALPKERMISFSLRDRNSHHMFVYFPEYIVSKSMCFTSFLSALTNAVRSDMSLFRRKKPFYDYDSLNIEMELNPQAFGDLTEEVIETSRRQDISHNNFTVLRDSFDFYLSFFDAEKFKKNIIYICAAYINSNRKNKTPVCPESWIRFAQARLGDYQLRTEDSGIDHSGFDEDSLSTVYSKAERFAYTVITLHLIVGKFGRHEKQVVEQYLDDLVSHKIRSVFAGNKLAIYDAFALFIQDEVFYCEKKIFWFLNNLCQPIETTSLTSRVIAFKDRIIRGLQEYRLLKADFNEALDEEAISERFKEIQKDFDIVKKASHIENIIKTHLEVVIKNGVETFGVAYRDGVVLVTDNMLEVRPIYMEDQMFSLGQAWIHSPKRFHWNHPLVLDIMKCFRQVFVEEENVQWFLRWLASLHAKKPERCLLIMYGEGGGNAKTTILTVLSELFGKYYTPGTEAHLFEDKAATCNPFTAELEGKVLIGFSELGEKKIPANVVKALTGGDKVFAAKKYKDPKAFHQTAKSAMATNNFPEFDKMDAPLADRIYILNCIGRYDRNAPVDPKRQAETHTYPRDDNFWKREGMSDALLWVMLNSWDKYVEFGLKPTATQVRDASKWKGHACPATKFIKEFLIFKSDDPKMKTPVWEVGKIYETFKQHQRKEDLHDHMNELSFRAALKTMATIETMELLVHDALSGGKKREMREVISVFIKDPVQPGKLLTSHTEVAPTPEPVLVPNAGHSD